MWNFIKSYLEKSKSPKTITVRPKKIKEAQKKTFVMPIIKKEVEDLKKATPPIKKIEEIKKAVVEPSKSLSLNKSKIIYTIVLVMKNEGEHAILRDIRNLRRIFKDLISPMPDIKIISIEAKEDKEVR